MTRHASRRGAPTAGSYELGLGSERRTASGVTSVDDPAVPKQTPARWPEQVDRSPENVLVRLSFALGSGVLEPTHTFLTAYAMERVNGAVAPRISVAVYELLSNAMSYATISVDPVLELVLRADRILIRVSNDAIAARVAMLRAQLGRIVLNAEETYISEVRRSVGGSRSRPMLGLARIAHEVGLDLEYDVTGPRVVVGASCVR